MAPPRRRLPRSRKPTPSPDKPTPMPLDRGRQSKSKSKQTASNNDISALSVAVGEIALRPSGPARRRIATQVFVKASDSELTSGEGSGRITNQPASGPSLEASSDDEIVYLPRTPNSDEARAAHVGSESGTSDQPSEGTGNMDSDISAAQFASSFLSRTLARTPFENDSDGLDSQAGHQVEPINRRPQSFWSRKAKKGMPPSLLHVSDEETREKILTVWSNDREKKKVRRLEREEHRRLGVLGLDPTQVESRLVDRYQANLTLKDLIREVESFCAGPDQSLVFPPLDRNSRKQLHEFAHRIGLASKSRGSGSARHPILAKPAEFKGVDKRMLLKAEQMTRRTEFFRSDLPHERVKVAPRPGEIVGQGWEEMSTMKGTKAKAMMEKMGWKMGEGLGTESNRGRAEPIQHVVRYSKAGLG